ncbi:MAG: YggS family pyridoxal phosphate-dependent enzyme [Leptonema sp. (in: Bacteria)]|nr:YggS family pyridoxal phosphate-dependent enzyme [Leptonema sp. (in: bacteria)]
MNPVQSLASIQEELNRLGHTSVRVIVVTKTHGPELIDSLIQAGHRDFGENRFNEAKAKFKLVNADVEPIYHHIGPLQSGFARNLPGLFQFIHGASSISALNSLLKAAIKYFETTGRVTKYLVQLNLTGEESKLGGMTESEFLAIQSKLPNQSALQWVGFMTMGPTDQDKTMTRSVFQHLRSIRDQHLPNGELSMGMSGDWQIAVDEGATMLRIGTAITGVRVGGPWSPT